MSLIESAFGVGWLSEGFLLLSTLERGAVFVDLGIIAE